MVYKQQLITNIYARSIKVLPTFSERRLLVDIANEIDQEAKRVHEASISLSKNQLGFENPSLTPVLVNLDNSVIHQVPVLERISAVLDAQDLNASLRYGTEHEMLENLRRRFQAQIGSIEGKLVFYGASDFHEVTELWVSMLDPHRPVSVIHFDNHTDAFGKVGWPTVISRMPHVKKLIQLGVDGDMRLQSDFLLPTSTWTQDIQLQTGGFAEVYPTAIRQSYILGRVRADLPSVYMRPCGFFTKCIWRNINTYGIESILEEVCDRLPTDAVYITLDTDCLRGSDAFTNYYPNKQGNLTLDDLLRALRVIARRKQIVAMDVTGDYSKATGLKPGTWKYRFERFWYSHIKPEWAQSENLRARNVRLNMALLDLLTGTDRADDSEKNTSTKM